MSNARQGWNAAQLASERRPVNRKALAPVGEWISAVSVRYHEGMEYHNATCKDCGYHVCSCPPVEDQALARSVAYLVNLRKMKDEISGLNSVARGESEVSPALLTYDQAVAACREGKTVKSERGLFYRFYGEVFWARSGPYQKWSGTRFGEEGLGVKHGPVLANRRFQVVP